MGEGANGAVFQVQKGRDVYALKIGFDPVDHQSEVNVLQALRQSGKTYAGYLSDADDWTVSGRNHPFYVMPYVQGRRLPDFIREKGTDWVSVIGLRLLGKLMELHELGWTFGDLKIENILVTEYGEIGLVDFGGATLKGRGVRQFTEIYDRGYWGAGSRTADDGYDLFALGILCLQLLGPERECFSSRMLPQNRTPEMLVEEVNKDPLCRPYASFLRKAFTGDYRTSREACEDWKSTVYAGTACQTGKRTGKPTGNVGWLKTGFAVALILFFSAVFLYIK